MQLMTINEARLVCRIDGPENDDLIIPMAESAEAYVMDATKRTAESKDPRLKEAARLRLRLSFRPNDDEKGFMKLHLVELIKQLSYGGDYDAGENATD